MNDLITKIEQMQAEARDGMKRASRDSDPYLYQYLVGKFHAFGKVAGILKKLPMDADTAAFQKGVQEGRRLEKEDAEHLRDATKKIREDLALTIADIEKLHTFLYAVKNNKHGVFTFTRLTDDQYKEVLRRFNKTKEQ